MIESGVKKEEYREIKRYWFKRLFDEKAELINKMFVPYKNYDVVRFHRGQGSKQTMLWEFKGITVDLGNRDWGAPGDRSVFVIKLGRRLDVTVDGITYIPFKSDDCTDCCLRKDCVGDGDGTALEGYRCPPPGYVWQIKNK